jgi:hypothetical protein
MFYPLSVEIHSALNLYISVFSGPMITKVHREQTSICRGVWMPALLIRTGEALLSDFLLLLCGFLVVSDSFVHQSRQLLGTSTRIAVFCVLRGFVCRQHCSYQIPPQRALANCYIVQRISCCLRAIPGFHHGHIKIKLVRRCPNPLWRSLEASSCHAVV